MAAVRAVAQVVVATGPPPPLSRWWADQWQCHPDRPTLDASNCALLAMAHVLSCGAALWATAIGLHVLSRAACSNGTKRSRLMRVSCVGLPLLACAYLAADRACGAADTGLPTWARVACNATGAPHFSSWADLADGVFSSGASAAEGDAWPLALLAAPRALAFATSLLASVFASALRYEDVLPRQRPGRSLRECHVHACEPTERARALSRVGKCDRRRGHMEPMGSQADLQEVPRVALEDPRDFYTRYVAGATPVVASRASSMSVRRASVLARVAFVVLAPELSVSAHTASTDTASPPSPCSMRSLTTVVAVASTLSTMRWSSRVVVTGLATTTALAPSESVMVAVTVRLVRRGSALLACGPTP